MPFTSSSKSSTKTMSSAASTTSTISTASTLKGADAASKKKWSSLLPSKTTTEYKPKPDPYQAQKAIHHEAVATYLALR
ncbi:hypothetical protein N7499_002256 [Penicillium canescens]|uniref:Uncharacterized protein n=1 Tax=Penicillium canescens TaxID=5083 RepID=A0AAD6I854_PENCN|nr:uncharacterized protein N7446_009800 [Penicillium canescens]KAJ6001876.1 hypothetical protein N7522_007103 [Penicillium canescens]KAJ6035040.1 hypothetical protein N7460_009215 [Penicillium canescens]KAJ6046702.1 hypothetical protein N7444_007956 [Penicillium canescens]KAJ6053788.1 hypothetical protein N7446_009800 [Penicillium canescens]KAJ6097882.1 hypothetical protein N7499_002256 [Penicillium canescens]